jgi:2-iminobutanoate/2-iminopropanoate deaminase
MTAMPGRNGSPDRKGLNMKRFLRPTKVSSVVPGQVHGLAHGGVFKRLLIAGQVGADPAGNVPAGFEAQAELAFDNLLAVIDAAQLGVADLIKIAVYVTVPGSVAIFNQVRERKIGSATPIQTYVEIAGLGDPRWLVSIEGEAIQEINP